MAEAVQQPLFPTALSRVDLRERALRCAALPPPPPLHPELHPASTHFCKPVAVQTSCLQQCRRQQLGCSA